MSNSYIYDISTSSTVEELIADIIDTLGWVEGQTINEKESEFVEELKVESRILSSNNDDDMRTKSNKQPTQLSGKLIDFLAKFALQQKEEERIEDRKDEVRLSTIHQAKVSKRLINQKNAINNKINWRGESLLILFRSYERIGIGVESSICLSSIRIYVAA